jgi:hypothetical protein
MTTAERELQLVDCTHERFASVGAMVKVAKATARTSAAALFCCSITEFPKADERRGYQQKLNVLSP